jgi:hypothetical protein
VTIYTAGNGRASTGDQSYAQGNIVVAGNISYNQPGNDVLGLIAKNSVIIACWQADNNLSWRAATMSLNGTWASDQSVSGSGCTATRGSMTFTGSTATYQGGGMGGYAPRTYNYDPTLRYLPPPDYPQIPASFTVLYQREIPSP